MFHDSRLSTSSAQSPFETPDDFPRLGNQLVDRERGGVAINDPSEGLKGDTWRVFFDAPSTEVRLVNEDTSVTTVLLEGIVVTEVSIAFDQNMRPALAYVSNGVAYLQWFDSVEEAQVTTLLGNGIRNPLLALDDKRTEFTSISDIILAYLRDNSLYFRMQRDRFQIERFLRALPDGDNTLLGLGLNKGNRLQFYVRNVD